MTDNPQRTRLGRTVAKLGAGCLFCGGVLGFSADFMSMQQAACRLSAFQPGLGDLCGSLGFGGMPTQEERLTWASRPPGDCNALRAHVEQFPDGAHRTQAAELLAARTETERTEWEESVRPLTLEIPGYDEQPTEREAQSATLARAEEEADQLCRGFATTTRFRLRGASPILRTWDCMERTTGVSCTYKGEAICELDIRKTVVDERCAS